MEEYFYIEEKEKCQQDSRIKAEPGRQGFSSHGLILSETHGPVLYSCKSQPSD